MTMTSAVLFCFICFFFINGEKVMDGRKTRTHEIQRSSRRVACPCVSPSSHRSFVMVSMRVLLLLFIYLVLFCRWFLLFVLFSIIVHWFQWSAGLFLGFPNFVQLCDSNITLCNRR